METYKVKGVTIGEIKIDLENAVPVTLDKPLAVLIRVVVIPHAKGSTLTYECLKGEVAGVAFITDPTKPITQVIPEV